MSIPAPGRLNALTGGRVRRLVIDGAWKAGVGHIGSALSVVDVLVAVYGHVLRARSPDDPDRDRFILSKGHAALALYSVLHCLGWLSHADLEQYCADDTLLGVHPDRALPGIDFSTGSLGHGLSYGVGAALAARMQESARRAFVLMSDAECNEGSVWEAAMFAAHHRLSNLVGMIDLNGQQALGFTRDVLSLSPMRDRWTAFGWETLDVDGHDVAALVAALEARPTGRPRLVIAHTTFGKGVSFMEHRIAWHYQPMTAAQYRDAIREIDAQA